MKRWFLLAAGLLAMACGSTFNLPNPLGPSVGGAQTSSGAPLIGPGKNVGTEVWLVPAPAGDLIRAVQHPELWPQAMGRVDVFSFYLIQLSYHSGFECGKACEPNTYPNLVSVVPGGAFRFLAAQHMRLAVEAGAVKPKACNAADVKANSTEPLISGANNVAAAGAALSYVSMDEPLFAASGHGCNLSIAETAGLVKGFIDDIHKSHPQLRVGLIEPYPSLSIDEIESFINELESIGATPTYFHLDMHAEAAAGRASSFQDVLRLREFCAAKGIPFAVIIWGESGASNEANAADSWNTARRVYPSVGVTEHTVFQSWAVDSDGRPSVPDIVPETDPFTQAGQFLGQIFYMGIRPTK